MSQTTNIKKLGIDIGGTYIKFVVLEGKEILYKESIRTNTDSPEMLISDIADEYKKIIKKYHVKKIGVGIPGTIKNGNVSAANLPLKNVPFEKMLKEQFEGIEVSLENDANCAALGETYMGVGEKYKNIVMITLGTGVGGGIILDRKICPGNRWMGEIGHMIVQAEGGAPCRCGMHGCWEQYASVTALIRKATLEAKKNEDSLLYKNYKENNNLLDGRAIFEAFDKGCEVSKEVLDWYFDWLAVGIRSIIKIFAPDAVNLAGGISAQKEKILAPLKKRINMPDVELEISELQNDAGAIGAAIL